MENQNAIQELATRFCLNTLWYYSEKPSVVFNEYTPAQFEAAAKLKWQRIKTAKYYVSMTDKFMSGWGMASNKTNKLIIACDTYEQASRIQRNANKRPEMIYVNICSRKPTIKSHQYPSWKHFEDMGEIWTK
jgi:hypothetical protein